MLLHKCKCGAVIPQNIKCCKDCEKKQTGQQSRHMLYNRSRRNKQAAEFYISAEWRKKRLEALREFDGIDVYAYYIKNEIRAAEMVHHIVPIAEDWSQRLNIDNLIPLSNASHNIIEALYDKDEATKQKTQKILLEIARQYREQGRGST